MNERIEQLEQQVSELEKIFASVPLRVGSTTQSDDIEVNFSVVGCNCLEKSDDTVTCSQCPDDASRAFLIDALISNCCPEGSALQLLTHQGGCIWRTDVFTCGFSLGTFYDVSWELEVTGSETATLKLDWNGTHGLLYTCDDFACRFTNRFVFSGCAGLETPDTCGIGTYPSTICVRVPQKIVVDCPDGLCEVSERLTATLTQDTGCPCADGSSWELVYDEADGKWHGSGLFGNCNGEVFTITMSTVDDSGCFQLEISCGGDAVITSSLTCDPFLATFDYSGEEMQTCCNVASPNFTITVTE